MLVDRDYATRDVVGRTHLDLELSRRGSHADRVAGLDADLAGIVGMDQRYGAK